MKYLLIIQFPEAFYGNINWVVQLEDDLEFNLINSDVDGHDIGSWQVDIFIYTDNPMEDFAKAKDILVTHNVILKHVKAAYRNIDDDQYICLWPEDLTEFIVT